MLCQPSLVILLVSVAGAIYHLLVGSGHGVLWWLAVGAVGSSTFQGLCYGGMEALAWVLMLIPVLLVCFFLAVALFASSMRIRNVETVPCRRRHGHPCGCPRCQDSSSSAVCPSCQGSGCRHCRAGGGCPYCLGSGCPQCLLKDSPLPPY